MARPRRIDPELVKQASVFAERATSLQELRAAQAILLPARTGATLEQTAELLGVGRSSVGRLQAAFRRAVQTGELRRNRGGRRNALMSEEEERAFLAPWREAAQSGEVPVISPLCAALAGRLGRVVTPSVVYRLLARHGWRKVGAEVDFAEGVPTVRPGGKSHRQKAWRPCP